MADYEKKYPFCAKETRGLTMRDAEWAFQLSPDPPKVEKLNDYIVMAARGDRNGFLFFLHAYEERLNCRIRSFLFREGYKRFYDLRDDPEKRKAYADEMEDYVRAHHLLIFDYPFVTHPELLREEDLYEHLSITKGSNVNVVRHLRYTPVFVHSHSFFTVLYVLRGQCGHTVGGADLPMKQGDVFFLPPYRREVFFVIRVCPSVSSKVIICYNESVFADKGCISVIGVSDKTVSCIRRELRRPIFPLPGG